MRIPAKHCVQERLHQELPFFLGTFTLMIWMYEKFIPEDKVVRSLQDKVAERKVFVAKGETRFRKQSIW